MPTPDEIFAAIHGTPSPATQPPLRVPGATVDQARLAELRAKAQRAANCYQPLPAANFYRHIPEAAQAPPARPREVVVLCARCGVQADLIPPNLIQCRNPKCRRLWTQK